MKANEIKYLDEDGAALVEIAEPHLSKFVSSLERPWRATPIPNRWPQAARIGWPLNYSDDLLSSGTGGNFVPQSFRNAASATLPVTEVLDFLWR
jgi:hypothetical protein